jgi:Rps23 Pro-64 3,4-dihydroxylase Tpa1-like proline 4-hydroxylase
MHRAIDVNDSYEKFKTKKPFKYIVLDNFLLKDVIENISNEFPNIESKLWNVGYDKENNPIKYAKDNPFEKKMIAISDQTKFPEFHKKVFKYFDSENFLIFLKKVTGIHDLEIDITGRHAGLRGMLNGSYQHVHSDAVIHPETGLRKRLSVILYLNESWKEEMGGCLELWNDEMSRCIDKILPVHNRLVIFECTEKSYHGVPEAVNLSDEHSMRKSLIFSYMSQPTKENSGRKRAKFVARPTDSKDEEIERLRKERALINQENEHRFM